MTVIVLITLTFLAIIFSGFCAFVMIAGGIQHRKDLKYFKDHDSGKWIVTMKDDDKDKKTSLL